MVSVLAEMVPSMPSQRTLCPSGPIRPGVAPRESPVFAVKLALPLAWSTVIGAVRVPGCGCPRHVPLRSQRAAALGALGAAAESEPESSLQLSASPIGA